MTSTLQLTPGEIAGTLIGSSRAAAELRKETELAASVSTRVMLSGEYGVGKGRVAHLVHRQSARRGAAFVTIQCGATPAGRTKRGVDGNDLLGAWKRAAGGTLFLENIESLSHQLQTLLFALLTSNQSHQHCRWDGAASDVRVIAATTVPLLDRCYNGEFRTDLYYLLNVIFIAVPPMRERSEDVETLLDFFTAYYARRYHRPIPALPASSRVSCRTYSWPGNLRQLEAAARMFAVSNRGAEAGAVLATTASMSGYNIHDPALQSQVHTSKKHRTICPDSYCYS